MFSITATNCGRKDLYPTHSQRKEIVIHKPWNDEVMNFVFGFPGWCITVLFLARCAYKLEGGGKRGGAVQTAVAARQGRCEH
jgi:hypothetical protein